MTAIDVFAWLVLIVIVASLVVAFVLLAQLPGKMAKAGNHPQADAIAMAGWLGLLLTLGVVWVLAMIWAKTNPAGGSNAELDEFKARLSDLEGKLGQVSEEQP